MSLACAGILSAFLWADSAAQSDRDNPFTLLYHFGNESFGVDRKQRALQESDGLLDFLDSLFNGVTVEAKTEPKAHELRERLQSFDIAGFYEAMPDREATRGTSWRGGNDGGHYLISMVEVAETVPWDDRPQNLGDLAFDLELSAPTDPEKPQYGVAGETRLCVGGITSDEASALADEFLARLSGKHETAGREVALDEVWREFKNLRIEDCRLVDMVRTSMPRLYSRLTKYVDLREVVNFVTTGGQEAALVFVDFRIDLEGLRADYPVLADYIEGLTALGAFDAYLLDLDGYRLMRLKFDAQQMGGTFQMLLRDGAIIPADKGWNDVGKKPIRLTSLRSFTAMWEIDVFVNFSGLVFEISDITLISKFRRQKGRVSVETVFDSKPAIAEVSGAAYGIFPSWLIDVVIPGNLQELMDGFIGAAAEGSTGDGTQVAVGFGPSPETKSVCELDVGFSTAVLHSDFLATVSDIFGDLVVPSDEERAAMWQFTSDAFDDFKGDYEQFRATIE